MMSDSNVATSNVNAIVNMNANVSNVSSETRAIMKKGSKTFSFAAMLFDRDSREGAELLYTWCRACDDAVDNEPNQVRALAQLQRLRANTARAFRGELGDDLTFTAFELLHRRHGIDEEHAQALLDGMQMDVEGALIPDDATLELYCYRVAGVVGLMMSKVMGVANAKAYRHAIDTGLAMQMTNISRDIREDFERRRTYIPASWNPPTTYDPQAFAPLARRLVERAEGLYASGEQGLRYLPFRAALAVACAQAIYREIGRKVVSRGARAWDSRTVVSLPRKVVLAAQAIARVIASRAIFNSAAARS